MPRIIITVDYNEGFTTFAAAGLTETPISELTDLAEDFGRSLLIESVNNEFVFKKFNKETKQWEPYAPAVEELFI